LTALRAMTDLLSAADLLGTADVLDVNDGAAANSRSRWRVSVRETNVLEAVFASSPRPNKNTIHQLATMLGVKPRQVQVWFQNRRQRWRKDFLELEKARLVHLTELIPKVKDIHGDPLPGANGEISMPVGWERLLLAPDAVAPTDLAAAIAACSAAAAAALSGSAPSLSQISPTPTTATATSEGASEVKAEEIEGLNEIDLCDLLNFEQAVGAVSGSSGKLDGALSALLNPTQLSLPQHSSSGSDSLSASLSDSASLSLNGSPGQKSPAGSIDDSAEDTTWMGMEWLIEDPEEAMVGVSDTPLC
jgi:hypothetical protein